MSVIKVLIVDDSALIRQTFRSLLETDPEIQVIGTASDPFIAVQKIQRERPDVITLDIEMPRMDGLTFLKKIMVQAPMPVVVISNQTLKGADVALKALEIGAVDVMTKPGLSGAIEIEELRIRLIDKVRSAFYSKRNSTTRTDTPNTSGADSPKIFKRTPIQQGTFSTQSLIAIGASTGGTEAIRSVLEILPPKMPPILIVQHMPEKFTASFAKRLNDLCALEVKEAEDSETVLPNTVYIAPGNHHMAIRNHASRTTIRIYQGDLVNRHRPSVNVLFHSVAEVKGKHAIGIILTGMGDDGAAGMLALYEKGCHTIAQDEGTSVVFGMPNKAVQAGGVCSVLPLQQIPTEVCDRINI